MGFTKKLGIKMPTDTTVPGSAKHSKKRPAPNRVEARETNKTRQYLAAMTASFWRGEAKKDDRLREPHCQHQQQMAAPTPAFHLFKVPAANILFIKV